jgi:hypothetical protein
MDKNVDRKNVKFYVLWIRNHYFSYPDPIFVRVLDPDPRWLVKSYVSSFGSDPKYFLFPNANNKKKAFSWHFKAYILQKMLD